MRGSPFTEERLRNGRVKKLKFSFFFQILFFFSSKYFGHGVPNFWAWRAQFWAWRAQFWAWRAQNGFGHESARRRSSTSSENELEISADSDSQQNADAESPEIWGESELEILKELVRSIEKNLNQGAALPQKAVSFNGKTNTEKIFNLTEEAVRRFNDSQEMPPRALKILNKTTEQGHKGFDLLNCFQAIARITQNDAIEMKTENSENS